MPEAQVIQHKFVEVEWADANSGTGWLRDGDPERDLPEPSVCTTRGWLVKESVEGIVLAGTIGHPQGHERDPEWNQVIAIPMGMVLNLRELEV